MVKELINDLEEKVDLEKADATGTDTPVDIGKDEPIATTGESEDGKSADGKGAASATSAKTNGAFAARLKAYPVQFVAMLISVLLPVWSVIVGLISNNTELVIDLTTDSTRLFALYIVSWVKAISIPLAIAGIAINLIGVLKIKTKFVGFFDAILIAIFCLAIWHTIVLFGAAA